MNNKKLVDYYSNKSKHSNYQALPSKLKTIIRPDDVQTITRYEKERLEYIRRKIDFREKTVIDIGANTGFFSFELLDLGVSHVDYLEGNKEHAEFVKTAVDMLNLNKRITVINKYINFDEILENHYDVALLFNVLHHVGDDYGDKNLSIDRAKKLIKQHLNNMEKIASTIVFQLGFNWQGNTTKPLFKNGTKTEQIEFVKSCVQGIWSIKDIAVAEQDGTGINYHSVNQDNLQRIDTLGEFLNRPIFILESLDSGK